jgi:hypothetical protein
MVLDYLLEEVENQIVKYYCIATEDYRYDIVVVHSEMFLGKAMFVSIQSGRMVLLSHDDIPDESYWVKKLDIKNVDINVLRDLLYMVLDKNQLLEQF